LRLGANVLFRHPSPVPSAERAALGAARDGSGERGAPRCTFPLPLPAWERKGGRMGDSYDYPGYGERSPFLSPRGSGRAAGWETVMTILDTESVPPSSPRVGAEGRQDGRQL